MDNRGIKGRPPDKHSRNTGKRSRERIAPRRDAVPPRRQWRRSRTRPQQRPLAGTSSAWRERTSVSPLGAALTPPTTCHIYTPFRLSFHCPPSPSLEILLTSPIDAPRAAERKRAPAGSGASQLPST